jgi:hypothetical protein
VSAQSPLIFRTAEADDRHAGPLFLPIVLVLAALLRFADLGGASLWIDEFMTWRMINPGAGHGLWEQFRDNVQGPLYLAVLWPFARGGVDEWLLRLPAALAGVLSVPLMLRLGSELRDRRTGEWAALLLALNPFHLYYSQEARGYAFLLFFSLAATVVLLRMRRRGPDTGGALAYGVLAGLAVLSNMSGLFLVGAQALGLLLFARPRERRDWAAWALAFGLAGLVAVPWLLQASGFWYVGRLAPGGGGVVPEGQAGLNPFAYPFAFYSLIYGYSLGPALRELHGADRLGILRDAAPLLAAAGLAVAAPLCYGWTRFRMRLRLELLLWILLPVACLTVLRLLDVKTFNPRYLATVLPLLLVVTAAAGSALAGRRALLILLPLLGLSCWSIANYHLDARYARDEVGAAAAWISSQARADEPVLVPVVPGLFELYAGPTLVVRDFWAAGVMDTRVAVAAALDVRLADAASAWLVLCRTGAVDPGHHLAEELAARGVVVARREFPGVEVLHWQRSDAAPLSPRGAR